MILSRELSLTILNNQLITLKQMDIFPCIGAELEFYLLPKDRNFDDDSWQAERLELDFDIAKEEGLNQFEVRVPHSKDIIACINKINAIKVQIINQADKQNMKADFSAKPFSNRPGSAMHIHLNLENGANENLYMKKNNQETEIFLHSIAGLCSTMLQNMVFFAPYDQAYARYMEHSLQSPSKVCWGINNRSAAIRIPRDEKIDRRLEHRVSASDACAVSVINAILYGITKGIREKLMPLEKVYGNAFLEQYDYPLLPKNFAESEEAFALNKPDFLKDRFVIMQDASDLERRL